MLPFQTVLDEHGVALYRHLVGILGPHDGADCYQETLLAALRAWPPAHDGNVRGWLFTVAHRKVIDHGRAAHRRPAPMADFADRPSMNGSGLIAAAAPAEPGARETGAGGQLWDAVRRLPPKQRAAVALRHADDWAYDDIAAVLECSPAAARQSVKAGLARLREVLA
jgi:RNA polymerase sigma factor (sigma-70 family)